MIRRLLFEFSYLWRGAPWDTGISPPELFAFLEETTPGCALDMGCGTGTNVITMAQHGWQATGIDISALAICKAKRKANQRDVKASFIRGDVLHLNGIIGPFDLVLDIGCFHSLSSDNRPIYAANIHHILQPGGTYLLYSWVSSGSGSNPHLLTVDTIQNLFHPDLIMLEFTYGEDSAGKQTSAWITMRRQS